MIKRLMMLVICFCFCFSLVYAGGVVDNNNGNIGDVLVSTGENHGQSSTGTWTNPNFLKGVNGEQGLRGARGYRGYTGKGLKDQYKVGGEIVIPTTKNTALITYLNRDFNNKNWEVGVKFQIKIGEDWQDKIIKELERRLRLQEDIEIRRARAWEEIRKKWEEIDKKYKNDKFNL